MQPYGMPRSYNAQEDNYWWRHWGQKVRNWKKRARQQGKQAVRKGAQEYQELKDWREL